MLNEIFIFNKKKTYKFIKLKSLIIHMSECIFCKIKNNQDSTFVKDFGNWIYRVNPSQFLLGTSVLVHKKHLEGLTSLSDEEIIEAFHIIKKIELALKKSFNPDWFNYLQTNNSLRHFHFHIIPRYKEKVEFEGEEFVDETFTNMPKESNRVLSKEVMEKLIKELQQNL
jgi:diadenosine tetraphosphate (Ap4A) HIT family hydrolase